MSKYEVGAYYFGNYHVDPRNEVIHGKGWTEWELLKHATARWPGHYQPRIPMWGYEDESDPVVMARKIDAAADHGLTYWIFDWYHYNDGPFLERSLDKGFLGAKNNARLKFALMWANHDWTDIHPWKARTPYALAYPGAVSEQAFDKITDLIVERYFLHPSYWKIDGRPYFSFYELMTLIKGLGDSEATRRALTRFREKVRAAGLPGLHLNAVVWGIQILPTEQAVKNPRELLDYLEFDSFTSYVWIHHYGAPTFPTMSYVDATVKAQEYWRTVPNEFRQPYFPNVTMGWDSSPRTVQSDKYENIGYPFCAAFDDNTPERFEEALRASREFLDARQGPKIMNINAWNEWTEGSYLEPDMRYGMAYLEAIKRVFG